MKTKTIILSFLFSPFFSFGQNAFVKHYGTPSNYDAFNAAIPTVDGKYFAVGTTTTLGAGNEDVLLYKFHENGNSAFIKTWDGGGNEEGRDVVQLASGEYVVTGHSWELDNEQLLLLKLNENGDEIWSKKIGGPYSEKGIKIIEMDNGGLVVFGEAADTSNLDNIVIRKYIWYFTENGELISQNQLPGNIYFTEYIVTSDQNILAVAGQGNLMKVNLEGEIIFEKIIVTDEGFELKVLDMQKTPDGKIWVAGTSSENGGYQFSTIDEEGEVTFYHLFDIFLPNFYGRISDFTVTTDSKIWAGFSYGYYGTRLDYFMLYDIALDTITEARIIAEYGIVGEIRNPILLVNDTSELFAVAHQFSAAEGSNGIVLSFDTLGNLINENTIGQVAPSDEEQAYQVVETEDGGFVILATKNNTVTAQDAWVIRTDEKGEIIWTAEVGSEKDEIPSGIVIDDNGEIIVSGTTSNSVFVFKLNSDGDLIWENSFAINGRWSNLTDVVVDDSGDIFVTAPINSAAFIHVSSSGDSIAFHTLDDGSAFSIETANGIALSSDGNIILCGQYEEIDCFLGLVIKVDKNGNLLWRELEGGGAWGEVAYLTDIHTNPNGNIYAIGWSNENWALGRVYFVNKVGLDGIDEAKAFEYKSIGYWRSLAVDKNGNPIIFGRKSGIAGQPSRAAIFRFNHAGQLIRQYYFDEPIKGIFYSGIQTSDDGFAAVGVAAANNSLDAYFVKTMPDGTVASNSVLAPPFEIHISPNPVSDFLQWSAKGLRPGTFSVYIYNPSGKIIRRENHISTAGNFLQKMEAGELPAGQYYFQIRQGEQAATVSLVK